MDIRLYKFKSIKTKLTFWLLLLTLVPLLLVIIITYSQIVDTIEDSSIDKLSTIRNLKVQQVNTWLDEINSDIKTLSHDADIVNIANAINNNENINRGDEIIQKAEIHLKSYLSNYYSYGELFIIDAKSGLVIASTNKNTVGQNKSDDDYFTGPMQKKDVFIKDIYYSNTSSDYSMSYSTPIFSKNTHNQSVDAILVARIDLKNSLYKILLNRTGLGKSGEILIVNSNVITINQLRWYDNAPLSLQIDAEPAIRAASGETGIVKSNDYRGQEVLAAFTFIPLTNWGVVVKQDTSELRIPVNQMFINFILIFIVAAVIISIMAFTIANSIAKTIVGMNKVARSMRGGNFKIRNNVTSNDELGSLASEFNNMADLTESRIMVQEGISSISKAMIGKTSMKDFSTSLVKEIQSISNANICVFYILNENEEVFEPLFSIGANKDKLSSFNSVNPEGDFGNAIQSRKIYFEKNIQDNSEFRYRTIVGDIIPNELITIPLIVENSVVAMISIVSLNRFNVDFHNIINQSWDIMNTSYSNFISSERTRVFADHLSRINDQLEEKTLELEKQTTEVKKQADKLHETSRELQLQNLELENQRKEVVEANKLKSEFLSNMSHELRTPLNSIMALSSVMITDTSEKLSEDEKNYLEIIERNGTRLLSLINDILDLSKIEAGKMEIIPEYFSITSLIRLVTENIQSLADQKGLIIHSDLPEGISNIESDELRLHQVLLNLISNAVKFTNEGEVNITARESTDSVEIKITDTGIGIEEDILPYIFDEFRQADGTSSRQFEGTGLGLAIAKKIITILGGKINVSSKKNIGTTFTLIIPIKWTGIKRSKAILKKTSSIQGNKSNKTILIVDDDPNIVEKISTHLKSAGYNTHCVTNGEDAITYARENKPFAITLDILMPEVDGWEVLQTLKKDSLTKDIPIIVVSMSNDKDTGIALGAFGHITKPIVREELLSEIKKADTTAETIMIVDDNENDLKLMADIIENNNITTIRVPGGKECLNIIKKITPNIIVLDLLMPDIDGFKVLNSLRTNPRTEGIPIIVVTAKDLTSDEKLELEGNVAAIIKKSKSTSSDLFMEVERIIGKLYTSITVKENDKEIESDLSQDNSIPNSLANILIIEDNPDNMITIKAILKDRYNFFEAVDGEEAIKTLEIVLPDLILLDMSLPKISGRKLVEILKSDNRTKHIPVIAVTADAMIGDRESIIKAGCDEYVSKPIDNVDILNKIEILLKH